MRLLDLVEKDHPIGPPPHGLGELAALIVADVTGRRAEHPADGVALLVLAHVDADQRLFVVEQELGQRFRQLGLAHAAGAQEDEAADGPLRVLQPAASAAQRVGDRLDRLVLADDAPVQLLLHAQQLGRLPLQHGVHRDAGPARHHACDIGRLDHLVQPRRRAPAVDIRLVLACQLQPIALEHGGAGEIVVRIGFILVGFQLRQPLLGIFAAAPAWVKSATRSPAPASSIRSMALSGRCRSVT